MSACLHRLTNFFSLKASPDKAAMDPAAFPIARGKFNPLPHEVMLLILNYLKPKERARCATINHYFYLAVEQTFTDKLMIIDSIFSLALKKAQDDKDVSTIAKRFYLAQEVELTQTAITGAALQNIALSLKYIREFSLENITEPFENIPKGAFKRLTQAHPEIRHLYLDRCPNLKADEIEQMLKPCKNLTELSLYSDQLEPTLIKTIVRSHPHITRLTLAGARGVDDRTLEVITMSCKNLSFLLIHGCEKVTVKGFQHLLKLEKLTYITLDDCQNSAALRRCVLKVTRPTLAAHFLDATEE